MMQLEHASVMGTVILLAFLVLVGPLAVVYGADSRLDEPRR
jgi:hypothetical protein